jgi:putative CocE/NonD family hydrolase
VDAPLWPSKSDQMLDAFAPRPPEGARTASCPEALHYYTTRAVEDDCISAGSRDACRYRRGQSLGPPARAAQGSDPYLVDFTATTGTTNRWYTQLGGGDVVYGRRAEQVAKLLSYRSEPLPREIEITGHPVVTLWVRSTHEDGAFYVYLDAEAPDGRVVYLTDGQLRALHRKVSRERPPYRIWEPYHSFERADGAPLVPGQVAELSFGLQPTSALIPEGWRLRLSIAGHDADNFARIPAEGDPLITVEHNRVQASHLELPVVGRGEG